MRAGVTVGVPTSSSGEQATAGVVFVRSVRQATVEAKQGREWKRRTKNTARMGVRQKCVLV